MPADAEERVGLRRHRQVVSGLSPPTSRVRRVIRRPPQRVGEGAVGRLLLVDVGGRARPRNRNSVRTRPARSAPAAAARTRVRRPSRGSPRRGSSTPSRVTAGSDDAAARASRSPRARRRPVLGTAARAVGGRVDDDLAAWRRRRRPACPAATARTPARRRRPPGCPVPAARIALCAVGLPLGEHDGGDPAGVERRRPRAGVRSAATSTPEPAGTRRTARHAEQVRSTWSPTARTSAARARR